jgi:hypothetical protein
VKIKNDSFTQKLSPSKRCKEVLTVRLELEGDVFAFSTDYVTASSSPAAAAATLIARGLVLSGHLPAATKGFA